jgi:hypothetical protein
VSPTFSGQLGSQKAQQGLFQLGAAGDAPYTPPTMPTSARPWMAHLYNNDWSFRASLGAIIGQRPKLRQTLNSGFQPVTIELPTLNTTIQPGNLIVITEQGGNATGTAPAGFPVIGGTIEQVPDTLQVSGWKHEITITPFVAELGDAYLNKNYSTATDVAQMVRDAVDQTNHLRYTPTSVPTTGITATYNFSYAPCLEVIDHARLIAGVQWSWFVDAIGVVWFQPINTNTPAMFTVKPPDIGSFQTNGGDISGLKNFVIVVGGIPNGASSPATATYTNPTSRTNYGLRTVQPPIAVPGVTDQPTLNNIAATVGGIYDRVINRVTIELPAYANRILLGQPGGATMRYFSPSRYPLAESETGTGTYSANYVVLDVETDGIQQKVTIGDVPPATTSDISYQVERLVARTGGTGGLVQPPFTSAGANIISAGSLQSPLLGSIITQHGINPTSVMAGPVGTNASQTGGGATVTATTFSTVPFTVLSFSLAATTTILVFVSSIASTAGASGQFATGDVFVDGTQAVASGCLFTWDKNVAGVNCQSGLTGTVSLNSGSHTIDFRVQVDAGQTWTDKRTTIQIFQPANQL